MGKARRTVRKRIGASARLAIALRRDAFGRTRECPVTWAIERVTVQNLQVMQVREAEKIILISGAVPGANGSYVIVRPAIKHPERLRALHAEHRKHEEEEKAKKPKTLREMAQKK